MTSTPLGDTHLHFLALTALLYHGPVNGQQKQQLQQQCEGEVMLKQSDPDLSEFGRY